MCLGGGTAWVIKAETVTQYSFKTGGFSGGSQKALGSPGLPWRQGSAWLRLPEGGEWGRGCPLPVEISPVPLLLQSSRAASRTGRPPGRWHQSGHSGAWGDGWRICPKTCTPAPRRRPWPAPHSAGTTPAGEAPCTVPGLPLLTLWTSRPAVGRLRVWALEGGSGTQGPCSSQAPVPLRCTQEPQGHLSEDASMRSRLPVIPRATTQRQQGDLKTFPDTHRILEQVGKSPCSWSQKLVSTCRQPAAWSWVGWLSPGKA